MAWSEQKKRAVVGGFIAFIMIFSIFGIVMNYTVTGGNEKYQYGDYEFKIKDGAYVTEINGKEHAFIALPTDVDFYNISSEVKAMLKKPVLTVTYAPASTLAEAMAEAQFLLEQLHPEIIIQRALTDNNGTSLPQASCADATDANPVIEFRESDQTLIEAKNNCIIVHAVDESDTLRQEELLRYIILGVI